MKTIQNTVSFVFIGTVVVLAGVSILGVWKIFDADVIGKSFLTLGLLSVIAVLVMIAGRFVDNDNGTDSAVPVLPNPAFGSIRRMMLGVLIASASILALLGVLAIWEVIKQGEVLWKSLGSIGIIAFASLLVVMTCREREHSLSGDKHKKNISLGTLIVLIIIAWMFLASFGRFIV